MRALRVIHRWLGLALALPLLIQGLTGALLTLEPTIPTWHAAATNPPAPANTVVAAATATMPTNMRLSRYTAPDRPGDPILLQFAPAGQPRGPGLVMPVDPVTARPLGPAEPATGAMEWIKRLHTNLLIPELGGRQIAGWFGAGLLLLTLLGLPLWWPSREQRAAGPWQDGFTVPLNARGARLQRRLHGALGIWLWLMMLATSTTGIIQGFPQTSRALLGLPAGGPPRARSGPPSPFLIPDLDAAIRLAETAVPGTRLRVALFPPGPEPIRLMMGPPGTEGVTTATTVLIDSAGPKLVSTQSPAQASTAETALRWAHDLHFGQGFGPVWRMLTVLVGVALPAFGATGTALWLLKRRSRRRIAFTREMALQPSPQSGD